MGAEKKAGTPSTRPRIESIEQAQQAQPELTGVEAELAVHQVSRRREALWPEERPRRVRHAGR